MKIRLGRLINLTGPASSYTIYASEPPPPASQLLSAETLAAIKAWIANWEGTKYFTYLDSAVPPNPSIGKGFKLNSTNARRILEKVIDELAPKSGLNYKDILDRKQALTNPLVEALFDISVNQAIWDARRLVSNFDKLSPDRQKVIVDMAYNLGGGKAPPAKGNKGLSGFVDFISAVESENWDKAANAMIMSHWYDQVQRRSVPDVALIRPPGPGPAPSSGPGPAHSPGTLPGLGPIVISFPWNPNPTPGPEINPLPPTINPPGPDDGSRRS